MITAHAAAAHAPEGQVRHACLHHHIVETDPTGAGGLQHLLLLRLIASKEVQRQGLRTLADLGQGLGEVRQLQHRQQGTEQFIGHQGILTVVDTNHCGSDAPLITVDLSADQDATLLLGLVQQSFKTLKLSVVDDAGQLFRRQGVGSVHLGAG